MQVDPMAQQRQEPQQAFVWGKGGRRMTADEIARERALAEAQMAEGGSYAPVQHWLQGAARLSQGIVGGLRERKARKAEEANAAETDMAIAELLAASRGEETEIDPVAVALNPYVSDQARQFGMMEYKRRKPAPAEPVIQRANNGDIVGIDPMTGREIYRLADPNPKPVLDWITADNPDGTKTIIPVGASGPMMGQPSTPALPDRPVGRLTPIEGGGVSNGTGTFPR